MTHIVVGIVLVVLGLIVLIFRNPLARYSVNTQNRIFRFHFGEREYIQTKVGGVLGATGTIIVGVLVLFGVLP